MRNSTARERIPSHCQYVRYTPGKGSQPCTKPFRHADPKHSYEEADEEGDMPSSCDGSTVCRADFHHPACQAYWREQVQQAPYHHHLGADGTLTTTHGDGSRMVTRPDGRQEAYPAPEMTAVHTTEGGRDDVAHYTTGEIETIDFIADKFDGIEFCLGNIVKYASRAKHKGQLRSDLDKIRNYAVIALELLDKQEGKTNG